MSADEKKGLACKLSIDPDKKISRRDFLRLSALWAFIAAWTLTLLGLLKFPMPALLPDVSNVFKIGKPEDIPIGTKKIIEDKKVRIVRDDEGIYAVSLICTHLGCIVSKTSKGYQCPCHGSKFDEKGNVVGGPAPRGLSWLEVSQLPSGKLIVDIGKRVPAGTKFVV